MAGLGRIMAGLGWIRVPIRTHGPRRLPAQPQPAGVAVMAEQLMALIGCVACGDIP